MGKTIHDFTVRTIDGQTKSLGDYAGKVLLVVNVASECGYTPQYAGLQALHEAYARQGFAVLGFPANDFGAQEPGTEADIKAFCTKNYGVTFDMFAKVRVKGEGMEPLFGWLQSAESNPKFGGAIKWNFGKFLVGKTGEVLARFEHKIEPTSADLKAAVEKAIAS